MASQVAVDLNAIAPVYTSTKAGAVAFTRTAGSEMEFKETGIRMLALCPGLVDTNMFRNNVCNPENVVSASGKAILPMVVNALEKHKMDPEDLGEAAIKVMIRGEPGSVWGMGQKGLEPFLVENMHTPEFWAEQMEKGQAK